jgi:arabinose-5-phosphate isomerase
MSAAQQIIAYSDLEQLREAREILRHEGDALYDVSQRLDTRFCAAADLLLNCRGSVIVSGMGKAGLIGQKITATLSSTGTRAHFLHPAEAVHGDLGCIHAEDVMLILSNSGETDELTAILPTLRRMQIPIIAVTATDQSTLARQADVTILLGKLKEVGPHGLAPTTTTTAMLGVGDALALVVSRARGFTPQQFAAFHPAGSLGRKLRPVTEVMRSLDRIRIAPQTTSVRSVFTASPKPGRRIGAVVLVDQEGRMSGIFTDSDLARLLERRLDSALDEPIENVMTKSPLKVTVGSTLSDVIDILAQRKISELPVVDDDGRPVGMIDITDVIGWQDEGEVSGFR